VVLEILEIKRVLKRCEISAEFIFTSKYWPVGWTLKPGYSTILLMSYLKVSDSPSSSSDLMTSEPCKEVNLESG